MVSLTRWVMACCLLGLLCSPFALAGQYRIEVVAKGTQNHFWKQVQRGCLEASYKFDAAVNFVGPAVEMDFKGQLELLNAAIESNPDAICISALFPEATIDLVYRAADAGIPVIAFDSDIGPEVGEDVKAFVATNNKEAGAAAAQEMYDRLKIRINDAERPVRIGIFSPESLSRSIGDRIYGFIERMEQLCGYENTAIVGNPLHEKGVPYARVIIEIGIPERAVECTMRDIVSRVFEKSDLIGVYTTNEFTTKCVIDVDKEKKTLGPDGIVGVGFDSGSVQIQAVRERVLCGSITQNPFMIGYLAVETAIRAAEKRPVKDVAVPFYCYTADNMNDPEISACLYD